MPGVFKTLIFFLAANPDLGLICTSNPFGIDNEKPVGIFSLEMYSLQIVNRLISSEAELDSDKIKKGNLKDYEWQQLLHKTDQLNNAKIFIEHAKGYVPVGEISILIAVGSGHRDEAFKICRYILEEVKHQSPIWKKEHYVDGKEEWLPGHSLRSKKEVK